MYLSLNSFYWCHKLTNVESIFESMKKVCWGFCCGERRSQILTMRRGAIRNSNRISLNLQFLCLMVFAFESVVIDLQWLSGVLMFGSYIVAVQFFSLSSSHDMLAWIHSLFPLGSESPILRLRKPWKS